jgi:putative tail protein
MSSSEAGLVGGIAGAAIGFAIGGPAGASLGWTLGSVAGGVLGSKPPGPQLQIAKLQNSSYGVPLEIVYGTDRRAGKIIEYQTPKVSGGDGGKGGGSSAQSMSCTWAAVMCEGPRGGLLAEWWDGELVYDARPGAANMGTAPTAIYLGTGTQGVDPTLEAIHGVGNVSAYRHTAYAVYDNREITKWGRIPNVTYLTCATQGRLPLQIISQVTSPFTWPATYGPDRLTIDGGILTAHYPSPIGGTGRFNGGTPITGLAGVEYAFDALGNYQSTTPFAYPPGVNLNPNFGNWYLGDLGSLKVYYWHNGIGGAEPNKYLVVGGVTVAIQHFSSPASGDQFWTAALTQDGKHLYVFNRVYPGPTLRYDVYDQTGTLVNSVTPTITPADTFFTGTSLTALPGDNQCIAVENDGDFLWVFDPASSIACRLYAIDGSGDFTLSEEIDYAQTGNNYSQAIVKDGRAYLVGGNQVIVFSHEKVFGGVSLASVINDLSDRAGLDATQYNTSDLPDTLNGFTISSPTSCQAAIEALMPLYFFDAVERAGVETFVKRGKNPIATIVDAELGVTDSGNHDPLFPVVHTPDDELPWQLNITFPDLTADWQPNTQYASRAQTNSLTPVTLQVAATFTPDQAKNISETLLANAIVERDTPSFSTTRAFAWLEPTDSVNIHNWTVRIEEVTAGANNVMQFKTKPTNFGIWLNSLPAGADAAGFTQPGVNVTGSQSSDLVMLDIPLITDTDAVGFYFAMAGSASPSWRGGTLYRSKDGGVNYTAIANQITPTVIGTATGHLGDFGGGNVFDEINSISVVVGAGGGELQSYTKTALLNGAGMYAYGREIIQARDATLTAPATYLLTGLLRGRRGTEWAMPSHVDGEFVVALPAANVPGATADLNRTWLYKAVTNGQPLSSADALPFTWTGQSLKPYSPCHVGGGPNSAGDVSIRWVRRTRIGGTWIDFSDVLLSETVESYVVNIFDSTFTDVARVITCSSPTALYTSAMQVTDFGAQQQHIYGTVAQVGSYGLGQPTTFVINGLGSVDSSVSVPVTPPGLPPPSSGCTLPVTTGSLNWATPGVSIMSPMLDPSMDWVVSLTTGAAIAGVGTVTMAEFGGGPIERKGVLSSAPCGDPLTPSSTVVSATLTWPYYMLANPNPGFYPTLAAFTTYYFTVNSHGSGVMYAQLQLPH